jgi:hypothetical protein
MGGVVVTTEAGQFFSGAVFSLPGKGISNWKFQISNEG